MDEPLWVSRMGVGGTGFFEPLVPQRPDPRWVGRYLASPFGRGITRVLVEVFLRVLKIHFCNFECVFTCFPILIVNLSVLSTESVMKELNLVFPMPYPQ